MSVITHTTKSAFMMAFHSTICAAWPNTTPQESETYFKDLGISFGASGFVWSVMSAIDLAKGYIQDCGEVHD